MIKNLLFLLLLFLSGCNQANNQGNNQANNQAPQAPSEPGIWENDILKFEQLDSTETYAPDALLFVGSSSIRMWNSIAADMAPYNVIQRGFGGSKLSDLVVYTRRIVSPHSCSAVILFVANDIVGNKDDKHPEEVAALFKQVVDTIRQSHPQTPVFWIETTATPSRWHVWEQASKANELIRQSCNRSSNTYFIKTRDLFLNKEGLPDSSLFVKDMLHLNEKGYEVWREIIKKEVESQSRRF